MIAREPPPWYAGAADVAAAGSVGIVGDTVSDMSNRQGIESGRDT